MWADFKHDLVEFQFLSGPSYIRAAEVEFSTSKEEACFSAQLYGALIDSGALPEDVKGYFGQLYESTQLRLPLPSEIQTDAGTRRMTALPDAPSECILPNVVLTFDHKFPKAMMLERSSKDVTLYGVPYSATVNVLSDWLFSFVLYTPHEDSASSREIRIIVKKSEGAIMEKDREWFRHTANEYAQANNIVICVAWDCYPSAQLAALQEYYLV